MADEQTALAALFKGWEEYQGYLPRAVAPLSPDQLELRAAPHLRTIGMLATHIIGARARWFHYGLGEGDAGIAAMAGWDREGSPTRTAAELTAGLETTARLIQESLARWRPADLAETFEREWGGQRETISRQWVIWHLIEHDLHHGGELSLTLGMHGLAAPDL